MLARIATVVAYAKAPRTAFLIHQLAKRPKATATALVLASGLRESSTLRKVAGGLVGLGALGVALPTIGLWAALRRRD